jgi:hypothetical protein
MAEKLCEKAKNAKLEEVGAVMVRTREHRASNSELPTSRRVNRGKGDLTEGIKDKPSRYFPLDSVHIP